MANNTNWLNISSQSGSSGQTILTLSANKNYSTNYKTAEITAYNPVYNVSAKTYVTLEAYSPYLSLDPTIFGVPDTGGTYELTINANCGWVIAFPDLVSSYSTTSGSGTTTVTFSVPSTSADTTLVGNIVVTDESGQISRIARIEQYGAGVHIGIFPVELYFDSTGGSKTFTVTADCAYQVSMSNTPWATVSPNSGYTGQTTFTVTVNDEYTGTTTRQGVVNIDAPGQDLTVILYQRPPETRLVATYYVTSTTDPTRILYSRASFSAAEYPDGTPITLGTGYTFPSTGYQTVYYTLTGNTVGNNAFSGTPITSVMIPRGVTGLGQTCFADCSGLTSVTLPNTLISIGNACFAGVQSGSSLTTITLPDSLTSIGWQAFRGCTSLSSITIPSAVTSIGSNCFSGSSVSSITFTSLTPPTLGAANALTSNTLSEIIVPCPAVNDYITAWPQYAQYISCQDTGTTLYFVTDTSNVKGIGETRTITILNTNINPNRTGLNLPSDFPQQGSYTVVENTIYITYPRNPSYSATRSWTIGVVAQTNDGVNLSGSYSITQNANVVYSIPYTADTSTVDASGETRTITIDTSNLVASSITIGVEGATGVTYTYQNGVITITFPENTGFEQYITVSITGETITGDKAFATISYVQDGEYIIPTGDSRLIVIYNVTSSTKYTPILYMSGTTNSFTQAELNGSSAISMNKSYRFPRTGKQAIFYTLKNNVLGRIGSSGAELFKGDFYNIKTIERVIVPSSVTEINHNCFCGCSLSTIELPNSLTSIKDFVFGKCENLNNIVLPNSLTNLGQGAFSGCTALSEIVIPDSVTSELSGTFEDCTSLTSVTIGSGITTMGGSDIIQPNLTGSVGTGQYAFCGCTSLPQITIPNNVTNIPNGGFKNCTSLSAVSIGTGVSYIGSSAFQNCTSLRSIVIPDNVVSLANDAFCDCTNLSSVTLSNNLYSVGGERAYTGSTPPTGCFQRCVSLSSITIPGSVVFVGDYCFKECTALANVTIQNGVQIIRSCVFWGCTSLQSITLPASITFLYGNIFTNCTSFSSIIAYPAQPPKTHLTFDGINRNGILYYQNGTDYSTWLQDYIPNPDSPSYPDIGLGSYDWTGQTF